MGSAAGRWPRWGFHTHPAYFSCLCLGFGTCCSPDDREHPPATSSPGTLAPTDLLPLSFPATHLPQRLTHTSFCREGRSQGSIMNHACLFILLPKDHMLLEKKNHNIIPSHLAYNVMHVMGSLKPIKNYWRRGRLSGEHRRHRREDEVTPLSRLSPFSCWFSTHLKFHTHPWNKI